MAKHTGTLKWFNEDKGFGFIVPDGGGKDVFVHINAVEKSGLRSLREGVKYEYDLEERNGKVSACNIAAA